MEEELVIALAPERRSALLDVGDNIFRSSEPGHPCNRFSPFLRHRQARPAHGSHRMIHPQSVLTTRCDRVLESFHEQPCRVVRQESPEQPQQPRSQQLRVVDDGAAVFGRAGGSLRLRPAGGATVVSGVLGVSGSIFFNARLCLCLCVKGENRPSWRCCL